MIDRADFLWEYLQPELKQLLSDGEILISAFKKKPDYIEITDYSFLVFPFAKAYEGFLKKFFLDLGMIHYDEYYGDEIRIGRLLNPHYRHEHGSIFTKMCGHKTEGKQMSEEMWEVWKNSRNLVFHYFPHNYKRLSFDEAVRLSEAVLKVMGAAITFCETDLKAKLAK